jgi:hypothetical protein
MELARDMPVHRQGPDFKNRFAEEDSDVVHVT